MNKSLEAFQRLLDIMDRLRVECPWDKKQTIESLRHLTIEEVFELSQAIVDEDYQDVRKELGDIKIILCEPFYCPLDPTDHSYRYTPHPDGVEDFFERPDTNDPEDSVPYRIEVNKKIRAVAPKIAEDFGCVFVPLYDKLYEQAEKARMEYFMWDGTHPSIAGHMLIADEWLKALDKI